MFNFIRNLTRPNNAVEDVYGDWWVPCHVIQRSVYTEKERYYQWRLLQPKILTWEKTLQFSTHIDKK